MTKPKAKSAKPSKPRSTRSITRSVVFDVAVHNAAKAAAEADDRSFSSWVNRKLREALNLPQPS